MMPHAQTGSDEEVRSSNEEIGASLANLYPDLVAALAGYVGSVAVAEDIAQDALVRAWERRLAGKQVDDWRLWVFRVAINRSRSWHRRLRLERRHLPSLVASTDTPADATDDVVVVRAALAKIPPRQRTAVVLRYYGDLSVEETAAVMGCASGTVKALTSQGLASLRRGLEERKS